MILEADEDLDVVGEASDGIEAVELVRRHRPDVVLMDIQMPVLDGLAATRRIAAEVPGPNVLVLTTFDRDDYVFEALRAGAAGFLLKNSPPEELVAAVRVVAAGDGLLAPTVTRRVIAEFALRQPDLPLSARLERLTERETEVLELVAAGCTNAEIAEQLILGEATVKTHISHLLVKLELRDRVQAVVFAYESGLVTPGQ
ncbi:MAG: response regulator [Acidimicrobiia bacterium]|nr:response regulator [Acidimicrobiia bacterium]